MPLTKVEAEELTDDICEAIAQDGFGDLTPQQIKDIIRGICDSKVC